MGLICKIFGHKWKLNDKTTSVMIWDCKRCPAIKVKQQYIGTAVVTEFDSDMNVVKEELEITRGN